MNIKTLLKDFLSHPVMRNNLFFSSGSYGFRIFNSLLLFSFAARIYDVEDFGLISIFILLVIVIYTALDYGHRMILVNEIAKDNTKVTSKFLSNKIWVKLLIFGFVSIGIYIYAWMNDYWSYNGLMIVAIIIAGLARCFSNFYFSIFQGLELFKNETWSLGVFSLSILCVIGLCFYHPTIPLFMYGYMVSTIIQLIFIHYLAVRDIEGFSIKSIIGEFDFNEVKTEFKVGFIFALIVLIEISFSSFDSFFVEYHYNRLDLGYYEGFKKIYIGLGILASVFGLGLFPAVSKKLKELTVESTKFIMIIQAGMFALGIVIFLIYFPLNDLIIQIILGENFQMLTTWDFHIALISIAMYLRVVPGIYFISSSNERIRLYLIIVFLIVESSSFIIMLQNSADIRDAIKLLTMVHVIFTISMNLIFATLVYKRHIGIKAMNNDATT